MTTTMRITRTLSASEIKHENSIEEIAEFILELDIAIADAAFTESLILKLASSLAADSKTSTMASIGRKISKMEGYES